jgi:Domain of unknown function (DUF4124)
MKNFPAVAAQFLALAFLTFSALAQADIYQWKDAEGKTQYSDQPPADRPARLVKSGTAAAPVLAEKSADDKSEKKGPKTLNDKDQDFRKRKIEAEKAEKEAAEKSAENKANCTEARNRLLTLNEGTRLYRRDEKGEKQYIDDKARGKEQSDTQADISKYCK